MAKACKDGHTRRIVRRCLPPLKGRKGQGKGRVSSRRGMGKGGAPCKYGYSGDGKCRRAKKGERAMIRGGSAKMLQSVIRGFLGRRKAQRKADSGEVTFRGRSGNQG